MNKNTVYTVSLLLIICICTAYLEIFPENPDRLSAPEILTDIKNTEIIENKYEKGILTDTSFESKFLNLRFTIPENFTMSTEAELIQMVEMGAEVLSDDLKEKYDYLKADTVYEMAAASKTGAPSIMVGVEKLTLKSATVQHYINILTESVPNSNKVVAYEVREAEKVRQIAGQEYKRLSFSGIANGIPFIQDYYINKIDDRMVFFIVVYLEDTTQEVEEILSSFTPYE